MTKHRLREAELDETSIQKTLEEMDKEGFKAKNFQLLEDTVIIQFMETAGRGHNYLWFEAESSEAGDHLQNYEEQGWRLQDYTAENGKVFFLFFRGGKRAK
jgi:hypothetical protein